VIFMNMAASYQTPPSDYNYKFTQMRHVGRLARDCLRMLDRQVEEGMTTVEVEVMVQHFAQRHDLISATKGYHGFPSYCCTSVNEEACHGIPTHRKLKDGDILKVDVTFINDKGWYGDTCRTFAIGKLKKYHQNLLEVAHKAMWKGIEQCKPGNKIRQIGEAIKPYVEKNHMEIARDWCGHGIGQEFHTRPMIPHYPDPWMPDGQMIMHPGMTFTIEPIVCLGKQKTKLLKDGWTVKMVDRKYAAQFEHTIGITEDGCEVFTKWEEE